MRSTAINMYLVWFITNHPQLRSAPPGNAMRESLEQPAIAPDNHEWLLEAMDSCVLVGKLASSLFVSKLQVTLSGRPYLTKSVEPGLPTTLPLRASRCRLSRVATSDDNVPVDPSATPTSTNLSTPTSTKQQPALAIPPPGQKYRVKEFIRKVLRLDALMQPWRR
jgi:hypothetical protein